MNAILAIARRELDSYFATPLGWVALTGFVFITGFFFTFFLFQFNQYAVRVWNPVWLEEQHLHEPLAIDEPLDAVASARLFEDAAPATQPATGSGMMLGGSQIFIITLTGNYYLLCLVFV